MKRLKVIIICVVTSCIYAGIIYISLPWIIFFGCLMLDDGGKLDNIDKISDMVTENQGTLEDIACLMLEQGDELEAYVDVEKKEISCLQVSEIIDEGLLERENIYQQLEDLYVKDMCIYKNQDVNIVIFETYSFGIVSSSYYKGFFYLPQEMSEDIFEYDYFIPYHIDSYGNIVNDWYYFEMSYG